MLISRWKCVMNNGAFWLKWENISSEQLKDFGTQTKTFKYKQVIGWRIDIYQRNAEDYSQKF